MDQIYSKVLRGIVEVKRIQTICRGPAMAALPEPVREQFFGSLDYAIFGRKL